MKLLISTLLVLVGSSAHAQSAADCPHRILLVPQAHATALTGKDEVEVLPENQEQTLRSQYSIAKYLAKHKTLPVFSEQVSSDKTVESVSPEFRQVAAQVKELFPDGLPEDFDSLNEQQKYVIAKGGGDTVSFMIRNTDVLHRVVEDDETENQMMAKVSKWAIAHPDAKVPSPEMIDLIFNVREKLALEQVNKFFTANPAQRDVVLIYGAEHSFTFRNHEELFPRQCILTPYEFQSAVTSPYERANAASGASYTPMVIDTPTVK